VAPNQQGDYTFFCGKGNENHELATVFLYIREPYQHLAGQSLLVTGCHIILRGRWGGIIVLNVQQRIKLMI
jgi:hypothetical protein